jgi:hypothetical protein
LEDRRLRPVVDGRPGVRVEPNAEVCAQGGRECLEHGEARLTDSAFDLRQIRVVDAGGGRQRTLADAGIETKPPDLLADATPELERLATDDGSGASSIWLARHGTQDTTWPFTRTCLALTVG